MRAGFTGDARMQRHVGKTPKGGVLPPRHGDQAGAERFQRGQDGVQLRRFIILRIVPTMPKAEFGAAHSRRRNLKRHIAAKNGRHILSVPAVLFLSISRCQTAL